MLTQINPLWGSVGRLIPSVHCVLIPVNPHCACAGSCSSSSWLLLGTTADLNASKKPETKKKTAAACQHIPLMLQKCSFVRTALPVRSLQDTSKESFKDVVLAQDFTKSAFRVTMDRCQQLALQHAKLSVPDPAKQLEMLKNRRNAGKRGGAANLSHELSHLTLIISRSR